MRTRESKSEPVAERNQAAPGYGEILVALDTQDASHEVLDRALHLAKSHGSHLVGLHCIKHLPRRADVAASTRGWEYSIDYSPETLFDQERLANEATQELDAWARALERKASEAGVTAEFEYRVGDPGHAIIEVAKNRGSDLIVVGRRGRSGLSELLLGSVSNHVVHNAPSEVLVVQHRDQREAE